MQIIRVSWVGTRTDRFDATVDFFRDVLGLPVRLAQEDFAVLDVGQDATVEVFGPRSDYNRHFTHPVAGFLVTDLKAAADELTAAGTEIVQPVTGGDHGAWLHFRAPDGFVYELTQHDT